ncbi:tRNA (adenosine(37)-N6)-dimethylallyltransferase MiaA [Desulfofundulus thermobenzoicus]|uniref:tRNA dimethylallyltransferase n=1 Tax=Desulfofundulus thermobenzoicus TaxID=29376 RepID=A0A6N7IQQ9_9FIRM|nr:tRNA (adenosine(37)-N6)-dimethylallyltransferase MiaA [Desulfofundulus thermobenzoicus]
MSRGVSTLRWPTAYWSRRWGPVFEPLPLLAIVGPTAVGKTAVSVEVARRLNGEIVSADSMLIYRYLDIGTAKPTMAERRGIPHHMIDIIDPDEPYSVALYQAAARKHINEIWQRGRLPMLVGGTGLFVRSVVRPYHFTGAGVDPLFREQMAEEARRQGPLALHRRLARVDPVSAERIHPHNIKRVIRALEVYHLTGRPMSAGLENEARGPVYNLLFIGLTMDRRQLYRRIEDRVDEMMAAGLVEEVKGLLHRGYHAGLQSMQGLGYREMVYYLRGLCSREEAVRLLKRNTRRFAKRQFTWFRREPDIQWIDVGRSGGSEKTAAEIAARAAGVFPYVSKSYLEKKLPTEGPAR